MKNWYHSSNVISRGHIGALLSVLMLATLVTPSSTVQSICTDVDNFLQLEKDTFLLDEDFLILPTESLLTCARHCKIRRRCASFNFHLISGKCFLNEKARNESEQSNLVNQQYSTFSDIADWPETVSGACAYHTCSNTSICVAKNEIDYECEVIYCAEPPSLDFTTTGFGFQEESYWDIGAYVEYQCELGFEPAGERVCQANGTWSDFKCLPIATCKDLQACNPEYGNGEYLLRPVATYRKLLKVYCHNMRNGPMPDAFITIQGETYSYFLDSDREDCGSMWIGGGITQFQKVKINLVNFVLMHAATTFATTNGTFGHFGRAGDCRLSTTCVARQTGSFRIDLTGSGLKIDSSATWSSGTTISKLNEGSIIIGECQADCKLCIGEEPVFRNGMFQVQYDSTFQPDFATATYPVCKL